ncbi:conserved hypothetical protein [delta proteobacterium NaphS2]|nr:conserved hypothetical protein [delta proteobacterium NaphS2]
MKDPQVTEHHIRKEIMSLPPGRRGQLLQWLIEMDRRDWDQKLQEDFSENGPGMPLLKQVKTDFRAGRCTKCK